MNRRVFFERLAAITGFGFISPQAVASVTAPRQIELQRSPVAGFEYHLGEIVWPLLAVGAPLELVREPANAHDARAVRIDWQGQKLGYVSRVDNAAVCHLLDNGQSVSAEIVGLSESSNPWDRVEVALYLRT